MNAMYPTANHLLSILYISKCTEEFVGCDDSLPLRKADHTYLNVSVGKTVLVVFGHVENHFNERLSVSGRTTRDPLFKKHTPIAETTSCRTYRIPDKSVPHCAQRVGHT